MPDLQYVLHRVQRSRYLIGAMRQAIRDLDRPDLVEVLDLAFQDATEAQEACEQVRAARKHLRRTRAQLNLQALARIDVPGAAAIASQVASALLS